MVHSPTMEASSGGRIRPKFLVCHELKRPLNFCSLSSFIGPVWPATCNGRVRVLCRQVTLRRQRPRIWLLGCRYRSPRAIVVRNSRVVVFGGARRALGITHADRQKERPEVNARVRIVAISNGWRSICEVVAAIDTARDLWYRNPMLQSTLLGQRAPFPAHNVEKFSRVFESSVSDTSLPIKTLHVRSLRLLALGRRRGTYLLALIFRLRKVNADSVPQSSALVASPACPCCQFISITPQRN